jgi:hypothetical protein
MKSVKPFVVVCGALMSAATVTGFISYQKAERTGKLRALYKEEQPVPVASFASKQDKEVTFEDYSRGEIKGANYYAAKNETTKKKEMRQQKSNTAYNASFSETKKKTKTAGVAAKKIKFESFSRAPLREPMVRTEEPIAADTLQVIDENL